jgi:outer membrane protein assembly factor BamB
VSIMPETAISPAPPRRRSRVSMWMFVVVLVLLCALVAVWTVPPDEFSNFHRSVVSMGIVSLTTLLVCIWWFCLSGFSWAVRLVVPMALAVVGVATIASVDWSGDMLPLIRFRWTPAPVDVLEAYRQTAQTAPVENELLADLFDEDDPSDYAEYRNRARDGVASGPPLARDWQAKPPRLLWKHPCGGGYSGFAVAGDNAVTIEQRREDEAVVCYDTATGRERWVHSYPAHFHDPRAEGPMATPTLIDGEVYSLGGTGKLVCLSLATGQPKWETDILTNNANLTWGMSGSPLVYGDVVVVSPGVQNSASQGHGVVAYSRKSGEPVWSAGNTKGGYSSPMLATLGGIRQILLFDGKQLAGYDPAGAGELWSIPQEAQNDINVAQPLLLGDDRVFVTSGYASRCDVIQLEKEGGKLKPSEAWHNATLRCRFCSPVLFKGLVYGLDEGTLVCVDPKDGRRVWRGDRKQRFGQGQMLRCDDLLLILSEGGELALMQAAGEKTRELGRLPALTGDKTWNCPCLAGGKAYLRNNQEMACYDLRE